jgi:hypothetical protein
MEHLSKMSHLRVHTPLVARVCKVIQYYMNKDFVHAKNECMYFSIKNEPLLTKFAMLLLVKGRKNW